MRRPVYLILTLQALTSTTWIKLSQQRKRLKCPQIFRTILPPQQSPKKVNLKTIQCYEKSFLLVILEKKSIDFLFVLQSKDAKSFSWTVRGMLLTLLMVGTEVNFSERTASVTWMTDEMQFIRKRTETISFTKTTMEIGTYVFSIKLQLLNFVQ